MAASLPEAAARTKAPAARRIPPIDQNPYVGKDLDFALRGFMVPHSAIRLYTYWLLDAVKAFEALTEEGSTAPQAFAAALSDWYSQNYHGFVHHHHVIEEKDLFPWIAGRIEEKDLGKLPPQVGAQHRDLLEALDSIKASLAALASGPAEGKAAMDLRKLVEGMAADLFEHLDEEERDVAPLMRRGCTKEELDSKETQIVSALGLSGAKLMLPIIVEAMTFYDPTPSKEHANNFYNNIPPPLRFFMWTSWTPAFKQSKSAIIGLGEGKVPTGELFACCPHVV